MRGSNSNSDNNNNNNKNGSCEDCGNKAKRDCEHRRCRTCCKSRGLVCPTHVRSTWIPVARRRRLLHHRLSASSRPLRLLPSSSSSQGLQGRNTNPNPNFPGEVAAVANFRCVRVSSDDNAVDQAAYQTSVSIGGHSFKGILYDQGPCSSSSSAETASTHDHHNHYLYHHHQLIGPGGGASSSGHGGGGGMQYPPPPPTMPLYPPAFNPSFLHSAAGMQFFPHPKP